MLILHSLRGVQSRVNIIILTNDEVNQMTQSDFKALTAPEQFQPFVVTLVDGFSIAIGELTPLPPQRAVFQQRAENSELA
jgi:hypothetical protein